MIIIDIVQLKKPRKVLYFNIDFLNSYLKHIHFISQIKRKSDVSTDIDLPDYIETVYSQKVFPKSGLKHHGV